MDTIWLILTIILATLLIFILILFAFYSESPSTTPILPVTSPYGVNTNTDANVITQCGPSRNDPCSFVKATLAESIRECETFANICRAFTFNFDTNVMKIVNLETTFENTGVNLFLRQS